MTSRRESLSSPQVPATRDLDDRLLDPFSVDQSLRGSDLDAISDVFERARKRGQRAWMTMAVCVGRAQAQAGRGDAVIERMAELFGLHRSRIARLGRIYREVLSPRLESERGGGFPLAEQAWYEIATEASGPLRRSAEDLLGEAESRKRGDPRYSTRRWKADLGITSADVDSAKLRGLLLRLSGIEDDAVDEFAQGDFDQNRELLQAASRIIDRASRSARPLVSRSFCRALVDANGELIVDEISPDLAAHLGRTPSELIGRTLLDLVWDAERARLAVEHLQRGERPPWVPSSFELGHFEFRHASGAKTILPLDYVVRRRSDGSFEGVELVPLEAAQAAVTERAHPRVIGPHDRWVLDVGGRTVWVTDAIAGALGETPQSMLGADFWEFHVDPSRVRSTWSMVRRDTSSARATAELEALGRQLRRRRDGGTVDLDLELTFLFGSGGLWKGVVLSPPLDLMHERLAVEISHAAPPAAPSTLERALAIWVIDEFQRTVFVSPEIAALLQTTPEAMVHRSALDFSPEPARWRTIFDLMRGGVAPPWTPGWRPGAIQARGGDGRAIELPLQLTPHYSPLGGFLGVTLYASATEVPDDPPAPTAHLREDAMWILRATDLETLFISPELAEILGAKAEELIGRSALPLLEVAGDTVRATDDLRQSEVLWAGQAGPRRFLRADATPLILNVECHPVRDARGQLTHIAAVFPAAPATRAEPGDAGARAASTPQ